jgi:hypothetical protein
LRNRCAAGKFSNKINKVDFIVIAKKRKIILKNSLRSKKQISERLGIDIKGLYRFIRNRSNSSQKNQWLAHRHAV